MVYYCGDSKVLCFGLLAAGDIWHPLPVPEYDNGTDISSFAEYFHYAFHLIISFQDR